MLGALNGIASANTGLVGWDEIPAYDVHGYCHPGRGKCRLFSALGRIDRGLRRQGGGGIVRGGARFGALRVRRWPDDLSIRRHKWMFTRRDGRIRIRILDRGLTRFIPRRDVLHPILHRRTAGWKSCVHGGGERVVPGCNNGRERFIAGAACLRLRGMKRFGGMNASGMDAEIN